MADAQIASETEETAPAAGDVLPIQRTAGTRGKKVQIETLGFLEQATGSDADTTMAVGKLYKVDMSAWATANRTYSLPTTAAVGDRIGIYIVAGNATYELATRTTAASNDTIDGTDHDSADHTKLFQTGEYYAYECITADTAWMTLRDGRINCGASAYLAASETTHSAGFFKCGGSQNLTQIYDYGDVLDPTTNKRIDIRRDGRWLVTCQTRANSSVTDQEYYGAAIYKNGSLVQHCTLVFAETTAGTNPVCTGTFDLADGDYIEWYGRAEAANIGCLSAQNVAFIHATELIRGF